MPNSAEILKQAHEPVQQLALPYFGVVTPSEAYTLMETLADVTLATQNGDRECVDIIGGFEGELDTQAQRGNLAGWKAQGLAWRQS